MSKLLLALFVVGGFAASLVVSAFAMVMFGLITQRHSKRATILAASLASAVALWLVQNSHYVLGNSALDVVVLYCALWFACFLLFWTGVITGIKLSGQHQEFGNSSILSMQYLDSRMVDPHATHGDQQADFQETIVENHAPRTRQTP